PVETSIPAATPKPASPKSASSGKRRNRKACFMCKSMDHLINDCHYHAKKMAQPIPRNYTHRGNHKQYAPLTNTNPQKHMIPTTLLTQSKPVSITVVRPVSAAVPKIKVTRPRHAHQIVTNSNSPIKRHITHSPSLKTSNSHPRVTAVKAPVVSDALGLSASSGKRRNRKACFMCKSMDHLINDCHYHAKKMAQPIPRNYTHRGNHKQYAPLTNTNPQKHMIPTTLLTQSKPVSITAVRPVSAAVPKIKPVEASILETTPNLTSSKTNVPAAVLTKSKPVSITAARTVSAAIPKIMGNPQYAFKDKGVIDSGCSRHITGNMSYLSDFEELNGGYVSFGGNPKGGKISGKGKIKTDDAFDGKEPDFDAKKHESEVNVSLSSSAQLRKQDDKTKKEAKGKSHVESFT
nr:hypothetical protein [Tanacetum cinerariifolium]